MLQSSCVNNIYTIVSGEQALDIIYTSQLKLDNQQMEVKTCYLKA
jgi:hypothetical protein